MNRLERAATISAIATAVIALVKFVAGVTFSSLALVADAIHSTVDIIGSIAVFLGIKFSSIKSKQFPYGLYKIENLISLFLALLIFYTGYEILIDSFQNLFAEKEAISFIASLAALFSLAVSFILAKYKEKVAIEENSPSMLAEAKHTWMDVITTAGVFVAVAASAVGFRILDALAGIILSIFIFKGGLEILVDSAKVLLDASLDYKTMKKIEEIVAKEGVFSIKEIIARNFGRYIFVDLLLKTKLTDFREIDRRSKELQNKIKEKISRIDKITVEIEYEKKKVITAAVPLEERKKDAKLMEGFGSAKYFALIKTTNKPKQNKILEIKFVKNPYATAQVRKGILTAEFLAKQNIDVLFVRKELKKAGAYYALKDFFVDIRITDAETLKELLEKMEVSA